MEFFSLPDSTNLEIDLLTYGISPSFFVGLYPTKMEFSAMKLDRHVVWPLEIALAEFWGEGMGTQSGAPDGG